MVFLNPTFPATSAGFLLCCTLNRIVITTQLHKNSNGLHYSICIASKLLFAYMYLNVYVFTLTLGLLPMTKSIKLCNKWMQLQPKYLLLATKGTMEPFALLHVNVLQGKLSAFSPVSLVLMLCINVFVCIAFTIVLIRLESFGVLAGLL